MPEYLSPGVYVEETSFGGKSIEGVTTSTAGFIGPARYGPLSFARDAVTSLAEFERIYGSGERIAFTDVGPIDNYLWHAVRAFFEEGGKRVHISRTYRAGTAAGCARGLVDTTSPSAAPNIALRARFPGEAGNAQVGICIAVGPNVLSQTGVGGTTMLTCKALRNRDLVRIRRTAGVDFCIALRDADNDTWTFSHSFHGQPAVALQTGLSGTDEIRIVTATVTVESRDAGVGHVAVVGLPLDPRHQHEGTPDSLFAWFAETSARPVPSVVTTDATDALQVLGVLAAAYQPATTDPPDLGLLANLGADGTVEDRLTVRVTLQGGCDGTRPRASDYEGVASPDRSGNTGLKQFEAIDDISIVAAPGSTFEGASGYSGEAHAIMDLLIAHAEAMRYRIAVLDSCNGQTIPEVRDLRARLDTRHAALYYPWIRILDPGSQQQIDLPPSGFVAGLYVRNDIERGVWKTPANEVVKLAVGLERLVDHRQQEALNPAGINCFRFFEGRGYRLWGARTVSSDPAWQYVNLRRYFAFLERSIDRGTQWVVFEPNGEALWANVRRTIGDFLLNQWQQGALVGDKPEKAFFVRCDRTTMTQSDLDNGRLVCLVGVAPQRPAEYVVCPIGQWTADCSS